MTINRILDRMDENEVILKEHENGDCSPNCPICGRVAEHTAEFDDYTEDHCCICDARLGYSNGHSGDQYCTGCIHLAP